MTSPFSVNLMALPIRLRTYSRCERGGEHLHWTCVAKGTGNYIVCGCLRPVRTVAYIRARTGASCRVKRSRCGRGAQLGVACRTTYGFPSTGSDEVRRGPTGIAAVLRLWLHHETRLRGSTS